MQPNEKKKHLGSHKKTQLSILPSDMTFWPFLAIKPEKKLFGPCRAGFFYLSRGGPSGLIKKMATKKCQIKKFRPGPRPKTQLGHLSRIKRLDNLIIDLGLYC